MSKIKWVQLGEWDPGSYGLVVVTQLRLRRISGTLRFLAATRRVEAQLRQADQIYAYSLKASPLKKTYWTLSLWQDMAALGRFVGGDPHQKIMGGLNSIIAGVKTKSWEAPAEEFPGTWDQAIQRLNAV